MDAEAAAAAAAAAAVEVEASNGDVHECRASHHSHEASVAADSPCGDRKLHVETASVQAILTLGSLEQHPLDKLGNIQLVVVVVLVAAVEADAIATGMDAPGDSRDTSEWGYFAS
jgi:hypothetical protein